MRTCITPGCNRQITAAYWKHDECFSCFFVKTREARNGLTPSQKWNRYQREYRARKRGKAVNHV